MSPETARPTFAPWDSRVLPRVLPGGEAARRIAAFAAVEARLGTELERWAGVIGEPHAQATLARHAKHHAWHAQLFGDVLADAGAGSGSSAIDPELTAFLDAVFEPEDAGQAIEFLTGVYRVLVPRKITAYTYFVRALGGDAADADARWFDFILKDEFDGIRDGELLIQSLLAGPEDVERSADRRVVLETRMLALGGLAGPQTLGGPDTLDKVVTS